MQADKEPSSKAMTWAFAVLGALVLGVLDESLAGLLIGGLLGAVLAQVLFLRQRAFDLQRQIAELRARRPRSEPEPEAEPQAQRPPAATPESSRPAPGPTPAIAR